MKSEQIQIRVTREEKTVLKRKARQAGLDVSAYVMSRLLPAASERFENITRSLLDPEESRYALADLHDLLVELAPADLKEALSSGVPANLPLVTQNRVAAMVEQAAHLKGVAPPAWTSMIEPLDAPNFATDLKSLRAHLLLASPVPFRRRNLFVDAAIGDRV